MLVDIEVLAEDMEALLEGSQFSEFGARDLRDLLSLAKRFARKKGEMILPRNFEEDEVFVVAKGVVRLYLVSSSGRQITLCHRRGGDVFELAGVDAGPEAEVVAEAWWDETVIYAVPWLRLLSAPRVACDLPWILVCILRTRQTEERVLVGELAFYRRKARLAHWLAQVVPANGAVVEETREALAHDRNLAGGRDESPQAATERGTRRVSTL